MHQNPLSGPLPQSLRNLALQYFYFNDTDLCEPPDAAFQARLAGIPHLQRTGVLCPASTATPTRTRTPTPTRTRTPTPGAERCYLPALLRGYRAPVCSELVANGGFEGGLAPWSIGLSPAGRGPGRTGSWGGWLGGQNSAYGEIIQWITLPAGANPAAWEFWWKAEAASQQPGDVLRAYIQASGDEPVLLSLPATGALNTWRYAVVDLSPYAGKGFHLSFGATTDAGTPTTFRIDDVSVRACVRP